MTDTVTAPETHLPECYCQRPDFEDPVRRYCICDRIRAAERRTVVRILEAVGPKMALRIAVKITEGEES